MDSLVRLISVDCREAEPVTQGKDFEQGRGNAWLVHEPAPRVLAELGRSARLPRPAADRGDPEQSRRDQRSGERGPQHDGAVPVGLGHGA